MSPLKNTKRKMPVGKRNTKGSSALYIHCKVIVIETTTPIIMPINPEATIIPTASKM